MHRTTGEPMMPSNRKVLLLEFNEINWGVIDIPAIRAMVEDARYSGLVEAEIFSSDNWWKKPPAETLRDS